jgi:hypothetical protein
MSRRLRVPRGRYTSSWFARTRRSVGVQVVEASNSGRRCSGGASTPWGGRAASPFRTRPLGCVGRRCRCLPLWCCRPGGRRYTRARPTRPDVARPWGRAAPDPAERTIPFPGWCLGGVSRSVRGMSPGLSDREKVSGSDVRHRRGASTARDEPCGRGATRDSATSQHGIPTCRRLSGRPPSGWFSLPHEDTRWEPTPWPSSGGENAWMTGPCGCSWLASRAGWRYSR